MWLASRARWLCALGFGAAFLAGPPAHAVIDAQLVVGNLTFVLYATWAPGDPSRIFLVDRFGRIYVFKNGAVQATPFLDISGETLTDYLEQGLLGLTFDPAYDTSGHFYVYFIKGISGQGGPGVSTVRRYTVSANPDVADPASAYPIFQAAQPQVNHKGGTVLFGPDGYLYLGLGDGGTGGWRSQDLLDPMGKFHRFDVSGDDFPADSTRNYRIPATNPYVGDPNALPEVWSRGWRNPYRFSFDRLTGDLWVGDVGQFEWEEIDFESASDPGGRNYGWDFMEGTQCYMPPTGCNDGSLTLPIYDYPHLTEACYSATGGAVYRGSVLGPRFYGAYFFGDFCDTDLPGFQGRIYSMRYENGLITDLTEWTLDLDPPGPTRILFPSAFVEDPAGEMYIVEYRATGGRLWKIVREGGLTSAPETASVTGLRLGPGSPNPFRGFVRWELSRDRSAPLRATIVDASGRLVRRLTSRPLGAIEWDGNDDAGRASASGVYFLRVEADGEARTRAVTRLR